MRDHYSTRSVYSNSIEICELIAPLNYRDDHRLHQLGGIWHQEPQFPPSTRRVQVLGVGTAPISAPHLIKESEQGGREETTT